MDIKGTTFRKGLFGFNADDVNQFLETASQEFEAVYTENYELREKIKGLEADINRYHQLENTLQQTLVLAQQTAEEVKTAAWREADLILKEAEIDRTSKVAETQAIIEGIHEEIRRLTQRKDLLRTQLRSFLTAHLDLEKLQEQSNRAENENDVGEII